MAEEARGIGENHNIKNQERWDYGNEPPTTESVAQDDCGYKSAPSKGKHQRGNWSLTKKAQNECGHRPERERYGEAPIRSARGARTAVTAI